MHWKKLKLYIRKTLNYSIGWPAILNIKDYITDGGTLDRTKVTDAYVSDDGFILVIEGKIFPIKNCPGLEKCLRVSGFFLQKLEYEELEEGGLTYDPKRKNFIEGSVSVFSSDKDKS